mmetsp:Transcript_3604/g.12886  ORF Transcript_3604/g.12886 Transcript_3604/m.12886 type:complete len:200 (+) Transcript_3604:1314-1913(+)
MMANPLSYVPMSAPKSATSRMWMYSSVLVSSSVLKRLCRRSYANLSVFPSMPASPLRAARKSAGVSCFTSATWSRVLRCSTKRRMKARKCSTRRMFPGTASRKISSGMTGLAVRWPPASAPSAPSCASPETRRSYSRFSRSSSVFFICSTFCRSDVRFRPAPSRFWLRRLTESASMQTLSMLCASSKTTMQSFPNSLLT